MSLPVLLRVLKPVLQPMLQSTPSPMTQMSLTTGESDPSWGLLWTQSLFGCPVPSAGPSWGRISCSRDRQPHESGPTMGQLKAQSSQRSCVRGHQRHEGGPTKGLPMVTHYQSHKSSPIRGQLRVQSSQCCNRGPRHHESSPIKWGLLRSCLRGSKTT